MGCLKMSVTIPEEVLNEIKDISASKKTKLSHLVTEALIEKIRKTKEEAFILRINKALMDQDIDMEQRLMALDIANNTQIEELPW